MGELQSANCGFHSLYLAFLPSVYIISEKRKYIKGAILSRIQAPMVRKELSQNNFLNFCPKNQKSPCKTRTFGWSCQIDLQRWLHSIKMQLCSKAEYDATDDVFVENKYTAPASIETSSVPFILIYMVNCLFTGMV